MYVDGTAYLDTADVGTLTVGASITIDDDTFVIQDGSDNTKLFKLQLSALTTGTTRTLTVPDVDDTIVTLAATQTLSNKTLTSPTITGSTITGGTITGSAITGGTITGGATTGGTIAGSAITGGTITGSAISGGTITGITDITVADGGTGASTAGGARTNLGLVIGTDVQAWATDLDTYSSNPLTAAELGELQNIGTSTISALQWGYLGATTAFGATLMDDANAAAGRTTLGVVIGTDVQAWATDLDTYSSNPLTAAELGELQNIGTTTISATQWGYVGAFDQGLTTTSDVTFAGFTSTGINDDATTNAMTITAAEDVGIGVSPTYRLDVLDSGSTVLRAANGSSGGTISTTHGEFTVESDEANMGIQIIGIDTANQKILFGDASDNDVGIIEYNHISEYMALHVNAAERVRVNSSGEMGIGTTAPDGMLHVHSATAGSVTASTSADDLVVENSAQGGLSILTPNNVSGSIYFGDPDDNDVGQINYNHSSNFMSLHTNASEMMRIDSLGRVGLGETSPTRPLHVTDADDRLAAFESTDAGAGVVLTDTGGSVEVQCQSGEMRFLTGGAASSTTTSGGTTKMTVQAGGNVGLGTTGPAFLLHLLEADDVEVHINQVTSGTYATAVSQTRVARAATPSYNFAQYYSSNVSDLEFQFAGDGDGTCDGSWTGGGADYAEWVEWLDGNPTGEDRNGISVVFQGKKVRPAIDGEIPDGVVSPNAGIIGNGDMDRWKGKYKRTIYGNYDLDEEGDRQLNPAYDETKEYTSRKDRFEWTVVGFLGRIVVRKGQPLDPRWRVLGSASPDADEYFVK